MRLCPRQQTDTGAFPSILCLNVLSSAEEQHTSFISGNYKSRILQVTQPVRSFFTTSHARGGLSSVVSLESDEKKKDAYDRAPRSMRTDPGSPDKDSSVHSDFKGLIQRVRM
jgi:hypothetical protein